ncbi:unnamed protein product [Effrenium voratum]|uniref:Uncharacterized protein n=1 Tax=Effrenium voratum TaxID=2562239 RepID=A0AA36IXQ4_9DINO|nr:unnamed protein product [Effrenium voratum]CAJ1442007.1 unnamed protein product [Effrenium voratum]
MTSSGPLLLPAAAVTGRQWQRFLLRMPALDATSCSPLLEEIGGEASSRQRGLSPVWRNIPPSFGLFAAFFISLSMLCVPPFARIAKFQQESALFFSFTLQLAVVAMYLPRLPFFLRSRRGPWSIHLVLGLLWCAAVVLRSQAYERLPIASCVLVTNIRMPVGMVMRYVSGKRYTYCQMAGGFLTASSILALCLRWTLSSGELPDGLWQLLAAALVQTAEVRLMRNRVHHFGGNIQEYSLFTHIFALMVLFPYHWPAIKSHIQVCLSGRDRWFSSYLVVGVLLHFGARSLASGLARRSVNVQQAQLVQSCAGLGQFFTAAFCSPSPANWGQAALSSVLVAAGNFLYLKDTEISEESNMSPALGKMMEMESPALKQVWAEATQEAKMGDEEAIRRENLAWRRIGIQSVRARNKRIDRSISNSSLKAGWSTCNVEFEGNATLEDLAPVPQHQQKLPCLIERAMKTEHPDAPPWLPVAVLYIFVGASCVWPYSKLLQRDPKSALCFNFILHVVILTRFLPQARSLLTQRRIPLRYHALMAFLWCFFTTTKSDAYSRLPTSLCVLLSNLRMLVGLILQFLLFGKRYSSSQILGAAIVTLGIAWAGNAMQHAAASKTSGRGAEISQDFFIGMMECLVSTIALALQGCTIKITFSRFGEHVDEQVFFTHLCALVVVFPSQWDLVGPRLVNWFYEMDPVLLVLLLSGVVLNFASRSLGTKLAGRAPNLLVLQLAQTLDGFFQLLVAALVRVPPWPPSGFWGGALVLMLGTLQYLRASGAPAEEDDAIPASVWKTPNSQAAWSVATVAARRGGVDAVRRENLNWRRLHLTKLQAQTP